MGLKKILKIYRDNISFNQSLVALAVTRTSRGKFIYSYKQRAFIIESAFLRTFISWETFLEDSFVSYLTGKKSTLNRKVIRHARPVDIAHAYKLTIGTNSYFDWSRPDIVVKLSKLFFPNGEPYNTVLSSIDSQLRDMKTIRNSTAHLSSTTTANLDNLNTRLIGTRISNIKAYDLLSTILPGTAPPITVLEFYIQNLDIAAQNISEA